MSVSITYFKGWKPGFKSSDITKITEQFIIRNSIRYENGVFIYLDKPVVFSCGDGNTDPFCAYFLNNNGSVEYYSYSISEELERYDLSREEIELKNRNNWFMYPVEWDNLVV